MDAEHDPRTAELKELYLVPHGISTILDVPLVRSGTVIGVVCHEHRGAPRKWTETERLFAGSIGDLVTLALETDERLTLEAEQRRLTARVEQMEKLHRQTDMAARVAHDFRNLLTPIFAHFDCFGGSMPPGPLADSAQDVLRAAERARALCDELMTYAGGKLGATQRVNLAELAAEVVRQQRSAVPPRATLSLQIEGSPPPVAGEPGQLHRAITNLVVNAAQAVATGGSQVRVTVRSEVPAPTSDEHVFDFRTGAGLAVLVEVADDGPGIQPEHRQRLFEPFFTTKAQGNGLGLPSVLGVVRGHEGLLSVRHGEGKGATFRVWFPVASP
jgi:signal transduction histidine kinase